MPPRVVTVPYAEDLRNMEEDIAAARRQADAVVVSHHWGIHFIPRMIADYQVTTAQAAFAAGADLILGHHAHVPKAIHVTRGKVCFYSLSNFIMGSTAKNAQKAAAFRKRYGVELDPDYPHLAYGTDAKRSLIAKALISRKGIDRVSFLPVLTLEAQEGRLFRPLAYTKTLSLLIGAILAITLDPALRMLFTREIGRAHV